MNAGDRPPLPPPPPAHAKRHRLAEAALLCGITSAIVPFIGAPFGPIAIGLGVAELVRKGAARRDRGFAIAGICTGLIGPTWLLMHSFGGGRPL